MSRILFVTPYYPPEVGAPQTRISETAVRLVKLGHTVTILTTLPNYPSGIVPPEYQHGRRRREWDGGVQIIRVPSYISPNKGFFRRTLAQLSFGCSAGVLGNRDVGSPDVIVVESPPLFDAISGYFLTLSKRCPTILTVADLWPEAAVQMGVLQNRLAIWLAERLERFAYHSASAIWTVTPELHRLLVERGLPPDRVFMIPNGVDTAMFHPLSQAQARAALGWDDRFTVLFAGTIGLAQGLSVLLEAADLLRDQPDIHLLLAGDGAIRDAVVSDIRHRGLCNVTYLGPQPHTRLPLLISGADACFVSLRRLPLFQATVPVKLYEAMACARPIVLATGDGLARQLAEHDAHAAVSVDPENPAALAETLIWLRAHPEVREELGRRGRAFVEAHFDRDTLTETLQARIEEVLARHRRLERCQGVPLGDARTTQRMRQFDHME